MLLASRRCCGGASFAWGSSSDGSQSPSGLGRGFGLYEWTNEGQTQPHQLAVARSWPQSLSPRALTGVFPEDFGVAACNHCLLNVGPINEQLSNGSAVAISFDPADAHLLIHQHPV